MKKISYKLSFTLSFIIFTILCVFLSWGVFPFEQTNAKAEEHSISTTVDLNTDDIGQGNTIVDYPNLIGNTVTYTLFSEQIFNVTISSDDTIVNIIPKEYFFTVGSTTQMGQEYGYFINTTLTDGVYYSSVLVFDIDTDTNLTQTVDNVVAKVSPIFQYRFMGLECERTYIPYSYLLMNFLLNYSIDTPMVIPCPAFSSSGIEYIMTEQYYLKDISFGASLYNENTLNYGDEGYNPYNDYGTFFTGFDYAYNGKYYNNTGAPSGEFVDRLKDNCISTVGTSSVFQLLDVQSVYTIESADIPCPTMTENSQYTLEGWYQDSALTVKITKIPKGSYGNKILYSKIAMKRYTVAFNTNGSDTSYSSQTFDYGNIITLPSPTRNGYLGTWDSWQTDTSSIYGIKSSFGGQYTVTGNVTFTAKWKRIYNISYNNLILDTTTAIVENNDNIMDAVPTYYFEGSVLNISTIIANPMSNQWRFLGWFTDSTFDIDDENVGTPLAVINTAMTGDLTLYAKWRYDYDTFERTGTYKITDSGRYDQPYDEFTISLGNYETLTAVGTQYLAITLKINMWEVYEGYQHIFIYNGKSIWTAELLWSKEILHGGGGKDSTASVHEYQIYIPLSELEGVETLLVRYGASGKFEDTWKNNHLYLELMYVVCESDISIPDFYYGNRDPFEET